MQMTWSLRSWVSEMPASCLTPRNDTRERSGKSLKRYGLVIYCLSLLRSRTIIVKWMRHSKPGQQNRKKAATRWQRTACHASCTSCSARHKLNAKLIKEATAAPYSRG